MSKRGAKVDLVVKEHGPNSNEKHITKSIKRSLPFYKSRRGRYVHRVRSSDAYWRDGELSHISVRFMCGNSGFLGEMGIFLSEVEPGEVFCATCEGRAVGMGLDDRILNGRAVMFSPNNLQDGKGRSEDLVF